MFVLEFNSARFSSHWLMFDGCRMVLGDRRKNFVWSGSVTDSVVGAFLTQNVSDALSSRAYMELASRWPAEGMMLEDRLARAAEPGHMTSSPSGLVEASDTVDWEAVRIAPRAEVRFLAYDDQNVLTRCIVPQTRLFLHLSSSSLECGRCFF